MDRARFVVAEQQVGNPIPIGVQDLFDLRRIWRQHRLSVQRDPFLPAGQHNPRHFRRGGGEITLRHDLGHRVNPRHQVGKPEVTRFVDPHRREIVLAGHHFQRPDRIALRVRTGQHKGHPWQTLVHRGIVQTIGIHVLELQAVDRAGKGVTEH